MHFCFIFGRATRLASLAALALLAAACSDDDVSVAPVPDYAALDEAALNNYLTTNRITTAQRQPSGLYLVPDSVNNTLPLIAAGKTVSVLYTGQLVNGQVFDASSRNGNVPFRFTLGAGQVIRGWDQGIALLHKGDKARLLIPSALGYGSRAVGPIPANSPLVFTVRIVDAQ